MIFLIDLSVLCCWRCASFTELRPVTSAPVWSQTSAAAAAFTLNETNICGSAPTEVIRQNISARTHKHCTNQMTDCRLITFMITFMKSIAVQRVPVQVFFFDELLCVAFSFSQTSDRIFRIKGGMYAGINKSWGWSGFGCFDDRSSVKWQSVLSWCRYIKSLGYMLCLLVWLQ